MKRPVATFVILFAAGIVVSAIVLRIGAVQAWFVAPFTGLVATAAGALLRLFGMEAVVQGKLITGPEGFAIDILDGCNGVDVSAILVSAVVAFRSTWKEKLVGLAIGIPGIQAINMVRIVTLYYLGLKDRAIFEQFHLYVWQTGVIIVSMALWIFWAEVLVSPAAPSPAAPAPAVPDRRGPSGGA